MGVVAFGALAACKAELAGSGPSDQPDAPVVDPTVDAPSQTPPDGDVPLGPWSAPMPIPGANDPAIDEDDPVLAETGLELVFAISEADGNKHLYRMTRATLQDAWSMPERLAINVTGSNDQTPRLSANGKTLYFASNRPGGLGAADIYMATRQTPNDMFANVTPVAGVSDTGVDRWFTPCQNGRYVMLSIRGGETDEDIYEGSDTTAPALVPISSANNERGLSLTPDCLTMYFGSNQVGNAFQLYTTTRGTEADPWPEETPFTEIAVMGAEHEDPWISADRRTFLMTARTNGQKDIYISTR